MTAAIDWRTFENANVDLQSSYAYVDPGQAEVSGQRLRLPLHGVE